MCAIALVMMAVSVAVGQPGVGRGGVVLHEPLPSANAKGPVPVFVYDPREASDLPQEIQIGDEVLPAPMRRTGGERTYDARGEGAAANGDREGARTPMEPRGSLGNAARPDRSTQKEASLSYQASFDPSVVPFKRNRALNHVDANGNLELVAGEHRPVPVIGHRVAPGREVFWGSVVVISEADEAIPLPTVAPDSRILAYRAEPERELRFERDQADNLYLRAGGPASFHLVYLIDADSKYFSRRTPHRASLADIPKRLRPKLPARFMKAGLEVAKTLGLSRDTPYFELVDGLVGYFRSFEPGEPPPETGDIYRDLALGRRGICRHRGYAFLVTAHALGVPARYVFNEAHVFVEIWMPGRPAGWVRADLGGGAEGLTIEGGSARVRHRPLSADPFSRPENYQRQMTAGADTVRGLPRESRARSSIETSARETTVGGTSVPKFMQLHAAMVLPQASPTAKSSRVSLIIEKPLVFRGEPLTVTGRVADMEGASARPGGKVQIVLRSIESDRAMGLLGMALTDRNGIWSVDVALPTSWPPGTYDLRAEFMGDRWLAPSVSP
jgi:transglutaminase-like putative cysteine protease